MSKKTILFILILLAFAPAVAAQKKKPKTYEDRYAAFYARHCATESPRLEECKNDPKAHGCGRIIAHDLDCQIAKILAEPIHHPTSEEWLAVYNMMGPNWELYDAIGTLNMAPPPRTYYCPPYSIYPSSVYRPIYQPIFRPGLRWLR